MKSENGGIGSRVRARVPLGGSGNDSRGCELRIGSFGGAGREDRPASNDVLIIVLLYGYSCFNLKRRLVGLFSLPDGVHPRPIALEGFDLQPQLLSQMAADESAHTVRLPGRSGHNVLEACPARPLQHRNHLGCSRVSPARVALQPAASVRARSSNSRARLFRAN